MNEERRRNEEEEGKPGLRMSSSCCTPLRFSDLHGFTKPNDLLALKLMDEAARVRVHSDHCTS